MDTSPVLPQCNGIGDTVRGYSVFALTHSAFALRSSWHLTVDSEMIKMQYIGLGICMYMYVLQVVHV